MAAGIVILISILILYLLTVREEGKGLYRMALFLERKESKWRGGEKNPKVDKNVEAVHGTGFREKESYYAKKKELLLKVLLAGSILLILSGLMERQKGEETGKDHLERPDYTEGNTSYYLNYRTDEDEEERAVEITVQNRKYTREEIRQIFTEELEELEKRLPGENASLERIVYPLVLENSLRDGLISVEWTMNPYGVIREDGTISDAVAKEGVLVLLEAHLTYQKEEALYSRYVKVFPRELSEEELFEKDMEERLEKQDEAGKNDPFFLLPTEVQGKKIDWFSRNEKNTPIFLLLLVAAVFTVWIGEDQNLQKAAQERTEELQRDYPELLFRLNMLLGAGLTLQNAFRKISLEYGNQKKKWKTQKSRVVYEELTRICEDLEKGVPEARAYENFGIRCQHPSYVKLGNLLSQNLRKGSKGLLEILENEAQTALEERKMAVRKQGEQAGVKLMLPMILLMVVVIVILIVPAFLSF